MSVESLAELSGVSKRYGNLLALDGLNLDVRRGELLAVLGPNGAGKTTAISLMLGLQEPDAGTASLFRQPPQRLEARRQVGVMMQEVTLAEDLRVREHIDLVGHYYPEPFTPEAVLKMTHMTSLANRPYGKLSAGQKRQAQFAVAVCGRPKLLFLDEPTVGMDVQAREMMWDILRTLVRGGSSIVLTTHYLEEAQALADRVVVLAKGRLVASGTVSEMRALVSRKRITCSTTLTFEEIATWPGVESVTRDRELLHITVADAEEVARRLLIADPKLRDLEVHRAGLAEAFTELTTETTQVTTQETMS
jgi:ABC-2 type transport system ATP-binding protein